MKRLDEIRKEKQEIAELVQKVADYVEFMEPVAEELSEEDLDLVAAAGSMTTYEQFLKRMKKK